MRLNFRVTSVGMVSTFILIFVVAAVSKLLQGSPVQTGLLGIASGIAGGVGARLLLHWKSVDIRLILWIVTLQLIAILIAAAYIGKEFPVREFGPLALVGCFGYASLLYLFLFCDVRHHMADSVATMDNPR